VSCHSLSRATPVAQLIFFSGQRNFNHGWTRMNTDLAAELNQKHALKKIIPSRRMMRAADAPHRWK
jgi:hypothetical protein